MIDLQWVDWRSMSRIISLSGAYSESWCIFRNLESSVGTMVRKTILLQYTLLPVALALVLLGCGRDALHMPPVSGVTDADATEQDIGNFAVDVTSLAARFWSADTLEICGPTPQCEKKPPSCAEGFLPEADSTCWTGFCNRAQDCARTCDEPARNICTVDPPDCGPEGIAAIRRGCWACVDPHTCKLIEE